MSKLGNVGVEREDVLIGTRRRINFHEGANVTIAAVDDNTSDEVDITITSAAAGGSIVVRKNSGADVGTRPRLNLIEGANITLTVTDDAVDGEVDIAIAGPAVAVVWLDQFFPAVDPDSHKGAYAAAKLPDTVDSVIYQTFIVPDDITTITNAVVLVIPEGTGNLRWQCDTAAATCGEDFETHTDSIGANVTAVTRDDIECIDISAALTAATGGDVVGIQWIRTASNAGDTVDADAYYLGILIQGIV